MFNVDVSMLGSTYALSIPKHISPGIIKPTAICTYKVHEIIEHIAMRYQNISSVRY